MRNPLPDLTRLNGAEHRGWVLSAELVRDWDEPIRAHYMAVHGNVAVTLDWSPYQQFEPRHFEIMVDHGFPRRRNSLTALFPKDVEALPERMARCVDVTVLGDGRLAA